MANSLSAIYLHIIFAVKYREGLLVPTFRARLHSYIRRAIEDMGHKTLAVGGTDDHVHILLRYNITRLLPDLVRNIKIGSTKAINTNLMLSRKFAWQSGYAMFSVSPTGVDDVRSYIDNQMEHHKGMTVRQEAELYLKKFNIEYDEKYLFDDAE